MSNICLSALNSGSLLQSAATIIYLANKKFAGVYQNAKTTELEEQFTIDCTKFVVDKLIKNNLGGSPVSLINRTTEEGEVSAYGVFSNVVNSIVTNAAMVVGLRVNGNITKILDSYVTELRENAIDSTIQQGEIKDTDVEPDTTYIEETEDTDASVEPVSDVQTFKATIEEILGAENYKYKSDILSHLQHIVSTVWVDGRVVNGSARGYTSRKDVANSVREVLSGRVKSYFTSNADGVVTTYKNRILTDYIVLDKAPSWMKVVNTSDAGITVYQCDEFTKQWYRDGTFTNIKFIVAPSVQEASDYIQTLDPNADTSTETFATKANNLTAALNNPRGMDPSMLSVYYSYITSTDKNFDVFMKQLYPTLSESYKSKVRTDSMSEGTISGEDQDSASLVMHKQTALRLTKASDGSYTIDNAEPYLTSEAILLASNYISKLPHTVNGTRKALEEMINSKNAIHPAVLNVLESLYLRFFAKEDYVINNFPDPITGHIVRQPMRSYSAMVEKDSHSILTMDDYEALGTTESPVAQLDDVISSLLSSMRSTIISDKSAEYNGVYRETDIAGGGATLAAFDQDILASTLGKNSTSTSEYIINDQSVVVAPVKGQDNVLDIKISKKTKEGPIDAYVTYRVQVNQSGKGNTLTGKPISILTEVVDGETKPMRTAHNLQDDPTSIANLFRQFKIPNALLNGRNFAIIRSAINSDALIESQLPLDELYLNILFPMILNSTNNNAKSIITSNVSLPKSIGKSRANYDIIETMFDYKPALSEILDMTEGVRVKRSMKGFKGETLSSFGQQTLINRIADYADQAANDSKSIHHDNVLVGPNRLFTVGKSTIKQGVAVGDQHKAVVGMTIKENMKFLIEAAYLQTMVKSGDHKTTAIQPGAQSDRQHPQITKFKAVGDINFFELQEENGVKISKLDTKKYIDRAIQVHSSYYKNLERALCEKWGKVCDSEMPLQDGKLHDFKSVHEVVKALDKYKISADLVMAEHGLQKMIYFTKKTVDGMKIAAVPEDIVQSIVTFTTTTTDPSGRITYPYAERLLESNRQAFREQLVAAKYDRLSSRTISNINKVTGLNIANADVAKNLLFDSYFYNAQILGVSALNLVTGGVEQFSLKKSTPLFLVKDHVDTKTGKINTAKVVDTAKKLPVPGSKTTLGNISTDELLSIRKQAENDLYIKSKIALIDSLTRIKFLLESGRDIDDIGHDIWLYDVSRHVSEKFGDQVKRNQTLGSGVLLPRLSIESEHGFRLGEVSKVVSVIDDTVSRKILGVSGVVEAEPTDGVVLAHPLYVIKLNNSIGNRESSFMCNGTAMKNISLEIDEYGQMRIQKKAEFSLFSPEILEKGNPLLYNMLVKMNKAIQFTRKDMVVHNLSGTKTITPITYDDWLSHGLSYGDLYYKEDEDAETVVVNARTLLGRLDTKKGQDTFIKDLQAGKYSTDKVVKTFDTLQDLYEYYGEYTNPNAFNIIAGILGTTHSMPIDKLPEVDLSNVTYDNRSDFIEKICLTSEEKTGTKNVISWENLTDPSYEFVNSARNNRPRWSTISNKHHGMILQPEHGYDVTSAREKVPFEHHEKSMVTLISQLISAVSAEGQSGAQAAAISNALNTLTSSAMSQIRRAIIFKALDRNPNLDVNMQKGLDKVLRGTETPTDEQMELLIPACNEYARELVMSSLAKQEDPGLAAELLSEKFRDILSFDQKQLLPLVQSQLFANTEKKAVRTKFAGGQFVVSPSHNMLTLYSFNGVDNLTRSDLNKLLYFPATKDDVIAVDQLAPLRPIVETSLPYLRPTDYIVRTDTKAVYKYADIKKDLKARYDAAPEEAKATKSFSDFLRETLLKNYSTRFDVAEKGRELRYTNWFKYTANGDKVSVFDTDEFKTYNAILPMRDAKLKNTSAEAYFSMSPDTGITVMETIPKGLFKTYYFDKVYKSSVRHGVNKTTLLSSTELSEFETWYNTTLKTNKAAYSAVKNMYDYISSQAIVDPAFISYMKADLYDTLENDNSWTSNQAEVHMPYMHCDDFVINDGADGTNPDSLFDITKGAEEPNWDKLYSLGILSKEESDEFKFNYYAANESIGKRFNTEKNGPNADPGGLFNVENVKANKYYTNISNFFRSRLGKVVLLSKNTKYANTHYANTFAFTENIKSVIGAKYAAIKARNNFVPGSLSYKYLSNTINDLKKLPLDADKETISSVIDAERSKFISEQCNVLAANFPKTLEFIMARIPGPSKQVSVSAKIKNFIFSSKNSVYGPVELLMMAGLDFDIDKQNIMTWSTEDGKIVDWKKFGIGTGISAAKQEEMLVSMIDDSCKAVSTSFDKQLNSVDTRLTTITEKRNALSPETDEYKNLTDKIIKLEKTRTNLTEDKTKVLRSTEYKIRSRFEKAIQNYVVHNLHTMALDPKNAIEMSAVTSTEKVKDAATLPPVDGSKIKTLKDVIVSQSIGSPMNPFSVPFYENITMAGRSGIGIYASDTKGYYAAYNASINASNLEQKHVALKSNITTSIPEGFGVDKTQMQFFAVSENEYKAKEWSSNDSYSTGEYVKNNGVIYKALRKIVPGVPITDRSAWKPDLYVSSANRLANAEKWSTEGRQKVEKTKAAINRLNAIAQDAMLTNEQKAEMQVKIIEDAVGDAESVRSMNLSDQAWDMFSNLVNAATDNAKELILGKIGANNTTGSLISTMVRFGVDLKHIIKLINTPEMQVIVKDIEEKSDIKTRQEDEEAAAGRDELYEQEYNKKLIDRLRKDLPSLTTNPTDAEVIAYLTNPIRQLYTYACATREFSTLSKILSANQGLPNDAFSGYNFIATIESMMNASVIEYNQGVTLAADKMPLFDMKEFVSAFNRKDVSDKDSDYIETTINNFDKVRTGINVPFTFFKNELFISYFNAFYQTKAIRDNISYINSLCESLIKKFKSDYVSEFMFKELSDSIYDVGVVEYLKEVAGKDSPLVLNGKSYDLSKPRKLDTEPKDAANGRLEFIIDLPDALGALEDNAFSIALRHDLVVSDPLTGISVVWLKGPDLMRLKTDKFVDLQVGLAQIEKENPALYNALFYYSLITTKGGYSGGSFSGLFPVEKYGEFAKSIKKNGKFITSLIRNNEMLMKVVNSKFLPQVRTIQGKSKEPSKYEYDDEVEPGSEFMLMDGDDDPNIELASSALSRRITFVESLNPKKFKLADLNKSKNKPRFVRSKDNSLTYIWNEDLGSYVPLLNIIPKIAIPLTLTESTGKEGLNLSENGYEQGFRANYPENTGTHCNVLFYLSPEMITSMSQSGTELMQNMLKKKDGVQSDLYVIQREDGTYEIMDGQRLRTANKDLGYVFNDELIIMGNQLMKDAGPAKTFLYRLYKSGDTFYDNSSKGQAIDIPYKGTLGSSAYAIYDKNFFSKVLKGLGKGVVTDRIDLRYNNIVDQLTYYKWLKTNHGTTYNPSDILFKSMRADVTRVITGNNIVEKVLSLSKSLDELAKSVDVDIVENNRKSLESLLISPDIIPAELLQALSSKEEVETYTIRTIDRILSRIHSNNAEKLMSEYANIVLSNSAYDKDMLFMGDNLDRVYVAKEAKSATVKSTNDTVLSKPLKLPNGMKHEYSKAVTPYVLFAICKHLNKTFPGVKWRVMNSVEISKEFGNDFPTSKGFVSANGMIVINSDKATIETPFHEFGHIYLQHLKMENPDSYSELIQAAYQHPLFKSVTNVYKNLTDDEKAEEVIVELISMRAANTLIDNTAEVHNDIFSALDGTGKVNSEVMRSIKIWLSNLFDNKAVLGQSLEMNDSLATTINKLADDMVYGKNSMLAHFTQETRDKIRKLADSYELPVEEARQILIERGYMQWYCV